MNTKDIQHRDTKTRAPGVAITSEIMRAVCDHIAVGGSLDSACRELGMPTSRGVRLHVLRNPEHAAMLHEARRVQAGWYADELVTIADNPDLDPRQAKNMLHAREWLLEKLIPALYGSTARLQVEAKAQPQESLLEHQTFLEAIQALWGRDAAEVLRVEVERIRKGLPPDPTSVVIIRALRPDLRAAITAAFGADALDRLSEALRRSTGEVRTVKAVAA